jgi:hypothetical protein
MAAVVGGLAWWWFVYRTPEAPTGPAEVASPSVPSADAVAPSTGPPEPLDLPTLSESDGIVREVVGVLSRHPRWAAWLVTDELAQRFVSSVANFAAGVSPGAQVPFLAPDGDFEVRTTEAGEVIDPASYRRYDPVTEAFVSFDTPAAVRLYQQLSPLFDEAHRSLGFPDGTFGATLAAAIDNVLAVQVPEEAPAVELDVQTFLFADPALEALSPAEKHVLRLGPENAQAVQAKLRDLRNGLVSAGAIPRR